MIDDNVKIGDIFVSSWGYDQTNIDFYQVIDRTAKMVTVREVKTTRERAHDMGSYVMPVKDAFLDSEEPFEKIYGKPLKRRLKINSYGEVFFQPKYYSYARPWDGLKRTETYTG
jgi:hypothetical protein